MFQRNQFRLGEVLRRGSSVWARNLLPFTILSLVLQLPLLAWATAVLARGSDPAELELVMGWVGLAQYPIGILLSAAVTYGVVMAVDGRRAPVGAVIATGLRRFLPALAVTIVTFFAIAGATVLLIIPGVIVYCMLYVAVPASVIERPGVIGALGRSRALTAGNRVRILLLAILMIVVNVVSSIIAGRIVVATGCDAIVIIEIGRVALVGPLIATMVATTYVLLRWQRDGAPAAELARVFE